ncbi:MAG: hypothetical protein JXC85_06635 [Candidatus Aenigmarchaeota archaeon]|nr:hypothetical protein [Candidatus Aenigmarchaeota archaeon]
MEGSEDGMVIVFGPVCPDLVEYFIATDGYLSPDAGKQEEQRYADILERLEILPHATLQNYSEQLNEIVAWEEAIGIFGDDGVGNIAEDFDMRLGPRFMSSQYPVESDFQGCGGLL